MVGPELGERPALTELRATIAVLKAYPSSSL
jgi:hypothetical protein